MSLYTHFERLSEWVKTSNAFALINQQDMVRSSEEEWLNSGFSGLLVECFEIIKDICAGFKKEIIWCKCFSAPSSLYPTTMCRALGYFFRLSFLFFWLWLSLQAALLVGAWHEALAWDEALACACRWFPGANGSQWVLPKFCHLQMPSLHYLLCASEWEQVTG